MREAVIELFKEEMKFSAGHFTVFSDTVRENLHGHNYSVYVALTTLVGDEGLAFDYRFYKDKLQALCNQLDETVLLAGRCKYLSIAEKENYYHIKFSNEEIIFLKRDVTIVPVANITVEELSNWFIEQMLVDKKELEQHKIQGITIKVFSGPGQSGRSCWGKVG